MKKKKVALYLRVSTDRQEKRNQERQLLLFCKEKGWLVRKVYSDSESAKLGVRRSEFDQMFTDAGKGKFESVVFWSLDRFSREGPLRTLLKLQQLEELGVGYISYQEQFLDSAGPFKEAVIGIIAAIAKMERDRISERTKAGLERARAEGKQLGRPRRGITAEQLRALREQNTVTQIAKSLGISKATIYNRLRGGCDGERPV